MNKYGKGSIVFVILIPIFIILSLVIVDTFVSYMENKKFKSTTEKIITDTMNNSDIYYDEYFDEIKKAYERNNYETDLLVVDANDYEVYVENEHNYFGLFTSLKNHASKQGEIKIFGVVFKAKKNSKSFVKVTAKYNSDGNIEFFYTK